MPVRPEETLEQLKGRVAGAFGLNSAFDLVGPEGAPLRSDRDVARASNAAGDAQHLLGPPHITVDVGEDALLDLERAHEESGTLRWTLLRKLLVELRRQVAEVAAAVSESKRQAAVLDEKLVAESSFRDTMTSSLHAEIRALASSVEESLTRNARQAQAALGETAEAVGARADATSKALAEAGLERTQALQREIRAAEEARLRASDEALLHTQQLRTALGREVEEREAAVLAIGRKAAVDLDQSIVFERAERQAADGMAARNMEALRATIVEHRSAHEADNARFQACVGELRAAVSAETDARVDAVENAAIRFKPAVSELEAKLYAHCDALEARLREEVVKVDATVEPLIRKLLSAETAARLAHETQLAENVTERLKLEAIERRAGEERVISTLHGAVTEAVKQDRQRVIEAALESVRAVEERILAVVEREKGSRTEEIQAATSKVVECIAAERRDREAACMAISSAESRLREQAAEEFRQWRTAQAEESREWAQLLVERLSSNVRSERDAALTALRRECLDAAEGAFGRLRADLTGEAGRLDKALAEISEVHERKRQDDRAYLENQAHTASQEVKAALDAQLEFAEALEREQRLVVERFAEGITQEGAQRNVLARRISEVECDMHKVRGHLPILFAKPSSFR